MKPNEIQEVLMARALVASEEPHDAPSHPAAIDAKERVDLGGESPCFAHLFDEL